MQIKGDENESFFHFILKEMNSYETQLRNLEEERDRFRRELQKYKRSSKEKVSTIDCLQPINKFRFRMSKKINYRN